MTEIVFRPELEADAAAVDQLAWTVFGPGMTARAAYVLREGRASEPACGFVAYDGDCLVGTVRQTQICIGDQVGLMLGPLAVLCGHKSRGIGRELMRLSVGVARQVANERGWSWIVLVGDHAYYRSFGFEPVKPGSVILPRPADPARILICPFDRDGLPPAGLARS